MSKEDDIKELENEKKAIELRAEIAKKQRELVGLDLSGVKAPEGTTKISGETPIEAVVLAYQALDGIAAEIVTRVAKVNPKPSRILIHDAAAFKALAALGALRVQLDLFEQEAKALIDEAEPPVAGLEGLAIPAVGAAITSALALASLFRRDVPLNYGKVEIADRALVVAVMGALKASGIAPTDSATMPVDPAGGATASGLQNRLGTLQERQRRLSAVTQTLAERRKRDKAGQQADPTPRSDPAAKAKTGPAPGSNAATEGKGQPESEPAELEARIAAFLSKLAAFQAALLKADEATGTVKLAQMLDAEKLAGLIGPGTAFLWLKVVAAGGGSRTKTFLGWSTLSYSGGAVASFALYDHAGALVDSGTIPRYSGFVRLDERTPRQGLLLPW